MKRVKNGRKSRWFMGRLLAGITAVAVFGSSLAVPGDAGTVYAKEVETSDPALTGPEVRSVNLNIDGRIAGLEDPTAPESTEAEWSNGTGTYIYYAGIGRSRLLDADTTDFSKDGEHSLFAVSDGQVDRDIPIYFIGTKKLTMDRNMPMTGNTATFTCISQAKRE